MKSVTNMVKTRLLSLLLVLVTIVTLLPATQAYAAEDIWGGGWEIAWENLPVYSDRQGTNRIGTIYKKEGFTILGDNSPEAYWYVEYSTPNGAKRGYLVFEYGDDYHVDRTGVARVLRTSSLYYGTNTSLFQKSGTVYAGEYVAILGKNDEWVYVEYNTTSGRKRGYMLYNDIDAFSRPDVLRDLYTYKNEGWNIDIGAKTTVYSGPSTQYATIGSVSNETVRAYAEEEWFYYDGEIAIYIEYYVNGTNQKKSGFIIEEW